MSDQAATWGTVMGTSTNTSNLSGFYLNGVWYPIIAGAADDDGPGEDAESVDDATEGDEDSDADDDADDSSDDSKTFSQNDVNRLLAKERKRLRRGAADFKELGFGSKKEMDDFVKAAREKESANKDEETKEREAAIAAAQKEAVDAVLSKADRRLIKADFKVAARDAGIPSDRLDDAFALAQNLEDWQDVVVDDDGNVGGLDGDFFSTLKEQKSYLFASDSSSDDDEGDRAASAGTRSGGKGTDATSERKKLLERYPGLKPVAN